MTDLAMDTEEAEGGLGGAIEIAPIGTRCIIRRVEEFKTAGGLYLPSKQHEAALIGEVMRVGDQCEWIKDGDLVMFGQFSGREFAQNLTTDTCEAWRGCLIMLEDDVLAIVRRA